MELLFGCLSNHLGNITNLISMLIIKSIQQLLPSHPF